ncbi:hypothetical protein BOTBODRAFT_74429, partial [Botryobasidium botryosum FD-172 SS1]
GWIQLEDLLNKGSFEREESFDGAQAEGIAASFYNSGTTGLSKGVMTTHRNLNSQVLATSAPFSSLHPRRDTFIPHYRLYGLAMVVLLSFSIGTPLVIVPRFDIPRYRRSLRLRLRSCFQVALIVPPIMLVLANSPIPLEYNLSPLCIVLSGAAPLAPTIAVSLDKRLKSMGAKADIVQGYGFTKISLGIAILRTEQAMSKLGSVGRLISTMAVQLVDVDEVD